MWFIFVYKFSLLLSTLSKNIAVRDFASVFRLFFIQLLYIFLNFFFSSTTLATRLPLRRMLCTCAVEICISLYRQSCRSQILGQNAEPCCRVIVWWNQMCKSWRVTGNKLGWWTLRVVIATVKTDSCCLLSSLLTSLLLFVNFGSIVPKELMLFVVLN